MHKAAEPKKGDDPAQVALGEGADRRLRDVPHVHPVQAAAADRKRVDAEPGDRVAGGRVVLVEVVRAQDDPGNARGLHRPLDGDLRGEVGNDVAAGRHHDRQVDQPPRAGRFRSFDEVDSVLHLDFNSVDRNFCHV